MMIQEKFDKDNRIKLLTTMQCGRTLLNQHKLTAGIDCPFLLTVLRLIKLNGNHIIYGQTGPPR
jgi:hypothetical protein